ncbi:hypothetical protein F4824DRAFT_508299 [Ustulina deusta]|nr:hypothetical protein F4824DRAFT_508299 [Ustulina deusta]
MSLEPKKATQKPTTSTTMAVDSTREESTTKEMTALAILVSRRHSRNPVTPPAPAAERKTFREIFCSRLAPEPAVVTPSPPLATSGTATPSNAGPEPKPIAARKPSEPTQPLAGPDIAAQEEPTHGVRLHEMSDPPRQNVDKEEALGQDNVAEHGFKTLKDSRWAKEDAPPAQMAERQRRRNRTTRRPKKESGWAKDEEEAPQHQDPPRLLMDMDEFKREIARYNLKTLKDSRWAD